MVPPIVLLLFQLLAPAHAAGPTVPSELLRGLPEEVLETLEFQEEHVESFTERIEARRQAASEARVVLRRIEKEAEKTRSAGGDPNFAPTAKKAASIGRAKLEQIEFDRAQARLEAAERDVEKQQARLDQAKGAGDDAAADAAKAELKRAKAELSAAKRDVSARKVAAKKAEKEAKHATKTERRELDASKAALQKARVEKLEAESAVRVAKAEIELFEAEQRLAAAELEVSRARAVQHAGRRIDLQPYEAARDEARSEVADARKQLESVHASAGLKVRGRR